MDEETITSQTVFSGKAFNVRIDRVKTLDKRETNREIVEHADCVAIVAVDDRSNILLVKQFRKSVEKVLLEIPAGSIDVGENPETAVIREMQEETGLQPLRVVRLGGFYSSPGFCTEYLHLYLAKDFVKNPLIAEDTAGIQLVSVPELEIPRLIFNGEICDSKSIAGLCSYLNIFSKGKL